MSSHGLFEVAPYAALAMLLAITPLRYVLARRHGPLSAPRLARARALFLGTAWWRIGMLAVLAAHAFMLLCPAVIVAWSGDPRLLLAWEAARVGAGAAATFGLAALLWRHLRDPALRALSSLFDVALLGVVALEFASGMYVTVMYRWASSWSAVTLTPYVQSLARAHPQVQLVDAMPYVVRLHVFCTTALLALLPFTHAMDLALVPFDRMATRALAPAVRVVRRAVRALEEAAQRLLHAIERRDEEDEVG